ncbi:MAG: tRNA lysidine(34) synthetase TilS [Bacillota bacterium]|nr:tRNA lysidine(34) synthetase TilS [Bacillota bacterium]
MIGKVLDTIRQNNMIENGDKIVVGVSGGPDSICLLHVLNVLKIQFNISIVVAHINHCLRGEEADKDEAYVKTFCEDLGVEFYSARIDVNKLAVEKGISCETAGRQVRYEFFEKVKASTSAQKIAIAHNANDQTETVLMRIIRGTGIEGMVGIRPVRDSIFIRPLIDITRDEIEEYCKKHSLSPRIDQTNLQNIYTRNKIRLELIPYIRDNFNKDIVMTINRMADTAKVDNDYFDKVSTEKFYQFCHRNKEKIIIYKEAFKEHEAILSRILRKALEELTGDLFNFDKKHIYDVISLQRNESGKSINLPKGIVAYNNYGEIQLGKACKETKDENIYNIDKDVVYIDEMKLKFYIMRLNNNANMNLKTSSKVKCFDLDKVKGKISVRYRRNGDKFNPLGMKGSKKIKDLFIDLKIPKENRDRIPLVCFGDDIAWIVGYGISDMYKVDKSSRNILEIKIESEE